MPKPNWDDYFMEIARVVATRSSCCRRQVGAVATLGRQILATGYNGTPTRMQNCDDGGCPRCSSTAVVTGEGLDRCLCVHAEANVVAQGARKGIMLYGCTLYTTHSPCLQCAKLLINSGFTQVVFNHDYPMDEGLRDVLEGHLIFKANGK